MFIDPPREGKTRFFVTMCFPKDEWHAWSRVCSQLDLNDYLYLREVLDPVFTTKLKELSAEASEGPEPRARYAARSPARPSR